MSTADTAAAPFSDSPSVAPRRKLCIRADGGAAIGLGHAMRCLALAQAWQAAGGNVTWLSTSRDESIRRRIEAAGATFVAVEALHPDPRDLAATLGFLSELRSDGASAKSPPWLVIDGHAFDADYLAAARRAGWRTLVIDDNGWLPRYDCDVLLNPNVGQVGNLPLESPIAYATPPETVRLLGLDYVLLRPEFARWRGWRREIPPVARRLLVMLGGSDPANVTPRVVRALAQCGLPRLEARVVVGPANPHLEAVRNARNRVPRLCRPCGVDAASSTADTAVAPVAPYSDSHLEDVRQAVEEGSAAAHSAAADVRLSIDPADLSESMAWADLCVTAAGSACWELAFMGLPSLAIVVAENQIRSVEAAERAGLLVHLGRQETLDEARMAAAIHALAVDPVTRERLSQRGRAAVDGLGAERVLAAMRGAG